MKKKEKKREEEKKRRKIRTRAFWIEDIYFPRGDANKNGIGVFRLIDKTVAAGCNSFPYHWPSSRSGYRGRCTLRARSSFHRLRSSRIEHWLSSDRPRRRSESFACTRLVVASKMTFIGPRGYSVDRPWPRHVHVWRVMWTSCTWKTAVRASSMSISQESAATIVCKEIFDGVSHPSDEGTWKNHEFKITDHRMPASSNPSFHLWCHDRSSTGWFSSRLSSTLPAPSLSLSLSFSFSFSLPLNSFLERRVIDLAIGYAISIVLPRFFTLSPLPLKYQWITLRNN